MADIDVWLKWEIEAQDYYHSPATVRGMRAVWDSLSTEYRMDVTQAIIVKNDADADSKAAQQRSRKLYNGLPDILYIRAKGFHYSGDDVEDRPTFEDHIEGRKRVCRAQRRLGDAYAALQFVLNRQGGNGWSAAYAKEMKERSFDQATSVELAVEKLATSELAVLRARLLKEYLTQMEEERKVLLADTFGSSFGNSWVGGWSLSGATGTFGTATVFIRQNHNGEIIDRVLVKDSHFTDKPNYWKDPALWVGGPESGVPTEIEALKRLRDREGSETIVRIRNWRISRKDRMHRILMEWCRGDFADLYHDYSRVRRDQPSAKASWVPEPFLWHMLESLATAGQLMQHGGLTMDARRKWVPIVHRDMKPANVLYNAPGEKIWKGYYALKMADFGLCVFMPEDDPREPQEIRARGTPSVRAPEQAHRRCRDELEPRKLSEKTNVWGIGILMWSMITLTIRKHHFDEFGSFLPYTLSDMDADMHYSFALRELVLECLNYDPDDRPTCAEILRRIWAHMERPPEYEEDVVSTGFREARNLRSAIATDSRWKDSILSAGLQADQWAIASRMDAWALPAGVEFVPSPPDPAAMGTGDDIIGVDGAEIESSEEGGYE